MESSKAASILKLFPNFRNLNDITSTQMQRALIELDIARGGILFRREAFVDGFYLLSKGALKVSIDDNVGREIWLAILGPGDLVGELGVIDNQPRSATVTALTACKLWRLPKVKFDLLARQDANFYHSVVSPICERLRITNLQVCNQRLGLEGRLAQTMLILAKAFGEELDDGRTLVRFKIAQSRLAEIVGVSRENVNRQLRIWREAGLYDQISSYYCLRSLQQWEHMAGDHVPTNTG